MTKLNLKKIYLWSPYLKCIVIILTIFLIFIFGYFFCLQPKLEKKKNCHFNLLTLEKKLNAQTKISSKYSSYRSKIENLKKQFDMHIYEQVGKIISPVWNRQLISSIENKNIISLLKVEISFFNTKNNITHFLSAIGRVDKFIFIKNFKWNTFNSLSKSQKQNIVFLFKIYMLNFSKKNLISAASKIIKLNHKTESKKDSLIRFPLNKIQMIGYYSENKIKNLGFVSLPNKQVCKVQLGDQLGLERGLVIGIYDRKIFILNKNFQKIIKLSIGKWKFSYVKNFT